MENSLMNLLFRDPVLNRLAGRTTALPARGALPETMVAKVTALKNDMAALRWQGGQLNATLDAGVSAGETLLLRYSGQKNDRPHYRIVSRMPAGAERSEMVPKESSEPQIFGLISAQSGNKGALPALGRFLPRGAPGQRLGQEAEPFLELFVETESFGLVMARFFFHGNDRLECSFVVESKVAGEALQSEADRLVAEAGGSSGKEKPEPLNWTVGQLRRSAAEALAAGGLSVNKRA